MRLAVLLLLLSGPLLAADEGERPYLVALDFHSGFDGGALGRKVGALFRGKATRKKACTVDAEIEWEERASRLPPPALEADPAEIARRAKEAFGCDLLVWGAVERIGPTRPDRVTVLPDHTRTERDDEAARLLLHVVTQDLRGGAAAERLTFECENEFVLTARVEEVLKRLTGVATRADLEAADKANRMQAAGTNLCPGDFSACAGEAWREALPGWSFPFADRMRPEPAGADAPACLRCDLTEAIADNSGLFLYSPYIPIRPDAWVRCSLRLRTDAPSVILFVKGYRDLPVETERRNAAGDEVKTLRQEVFKHQVRFYGRRGEWALLETRPFLPRSVDPAHAPQFLRVQPYAYHPAGTVRFADLVVRECEEAP